MISDMKSVEHPTRKMYIKASLQPSERATGGAWFTDGDLDEDFIETIMKILYQYIKKRSWYNSQDRDRKKKMPKKTHRKVTPEEVKAARDKALGPMDVKMEDREPVVKTEYERLLPLPAGYQEYPTVDEMTAFILDKEVSKGTTLSSQEIQQLLDLLVYDGKIERLVAGPEAFAYKSVRKTFLEEDEQMNSVLTEAPCGRCPVFDLCEEGGPVGPSNCEYFSDWLDL
jgi:DNA-directed RNA polymerase III subunit RPC6